MLHSTKGIVFHSLRYSETSLIVKIYTELFGIQSYLFKGIRGPKSKIKRGLFQPLTLLDLVVYHKENQSLQSVKEAHLAHPYQTIPFDIRKSSLALFINELVYKTIREEESNPGLFEFLWQSCLQLDATDEPVSGFHLFFALQFCHYLGIFPQTNYSDQLPVFNLREGFFQSAVPDHPQYLNPEYSKLFYTVLKVCSLQSGSLQFGSLQSGSLQFGSLQSGSLQSEENGEMAKWRNGEIAKWRNGEIFTNMTAETRNQLLETILLYYRLHLPGFRGLQSHHILHDVMA